MSEPAAKLRSISGILQQCGAEEEDKEIKFDLRLCFDVLFELFQFGDRRQLTKLERIGRRFHHLVEKCFGELPFLRLDIELAPLCNGLEAFVGKQKVNILRATLVFPPFVRSNEVRLRFHFSTSQSLPEKCRLFEDCLDLIRPTLKDSNETYFFAEIDQEDQSDFSDHESLVIYLRDRLLPICDSSHRYVFDIFFKSEKNSAAEVISSILQIPQVRSCSNVSIVLRVNSAIRLPVEDISNWLSPKTNVCGKKEPNRYLKICSGKIPKSQRMWDHLKEKFAEAKHPAIPFTLHFKGVVGFSDIYDVQKLSNQKTNEELSILSAIEYDDGHIGTEIRRTVKQRKNSQLKP